MKKKERKRIPEIVREMIIKHHLLPEGKQVVAAVSGGADSVALVRALHILGKTCMVAHVNHGLRGAESDADERFVQFLAGELGYSCSIGRVDTSELAQAHGESVEMAGRRARHAFFATFENAVVVLGHHADDQAETFFLRLARGSAGLAGMSWKQNVGKLIVVRPMLGLLHSDLVTWLMANGWSWREDASNCNDAYMRNRIRSKVMPLLAENLNPDMVQTLNRTMGILRDEEAWMWSQATGHQIDALQGLPRALQRRVLRIWLHSEGVVQPGFGLVEQILDGVDAGEGTICCDLNVGLRVMIEYGVPRLERRDIRVDVPQWTLSVEYGIGWKKDHGRGAGVLPAEASLNAVCVDDCGFHVRAIQPGDAVAPLGMEGRRKLQDILTDQKVPRALRTHVPVVVCRDEIVWVPGYRIAKEWAVPSSTSPSVQLRIERCKRV